MMQSELSDYHSSGETCPTCGETFETRSWVGRHHKSEHGETLMEYEERNRDTLTCPEGCGEFQNLITHWRMEHNRPFPDGVKRVTEKLSETMSDKQMGKTLSEETRRKIGEAQEGVERPDKVGEKISGALTGRELSDEHCRKISEVQKGKTLSEETRRKISEASKEMWQSDEHREKVSEALTGNTHTEESKRKMSEAKRGTTRSEETRRKISETKKGTTLSDEHIQKVIEARKGDGRLCSVPTGHTVRSRWELEIDLMLYDEGLDFGYEPETFDIDTQRYTPDFRVGGDIIEVKGYDWGNSVERAEQFMESHPEYRYIVVGTELPADVWIPWEEREKLCDVIDNG